MNLKDLKNYEIEDSNTDDKPLNISDIASDYEVEEQDKPSKIESLARGSAQGLTWGFADELSGVGEALGNAILDPNKFSNLMENYKKYRDESRANFKSAEEANPATYMTGEIGAGIATGLLTGGAGAVANLGRVGLQQGAKQLLIQGAAQGAAAGLGSSEGEDLGQLTRDTIIGGGVGAGIGLALPQGANLTKAGANKVGKFVADKAPEFIKKGKQAFELAKKGIKVVGQEAEDNLNQDADKISNQIIDSFKSQYEQGSKKVGNALKSLPEGVDFSKQMLEIEDALSKSKMLPDDLAKIRAELDLYKQTSNYKTFSPQRNEAEKAIKETISKQKGEANILGQKVDFIPQADTEDGKFIQILKRTFLPEGEEQASVISQKIPDMKVLEGSIENFRKMDLQELNNVKKELADLVGSNKLSSYSKSVLNNIKKQVDNTIEQNLDTTNKALYESGNKDIKNVYSAGELLGVLSPDKRFANDLDIALKQKITSSSNANKETVKRALDYGNIPQQTKEEISDLPLRGELLKNIKGEGSLLGGFINPKGTSIRLGEIAGNVSNSKTVSSVKDFTKKMINLDDNSLSKLATKIDPSFGQTIQKALQDVTKRDRLLWALSQQPAFRQAYEKSQQEEQIINNDTEN